MAFHLLPPLLLIIIASSVYTQTFQYSRGWTNGKRSEGLRTEEKLENILERVVENPCQLGKLKYILEGNPITDKIFLPCDYSSEDLSVESRPKRPPYGKILRGSREPLYDNFL